MILTLKKKKKKDTATLVFNLVGTGNKWIKVNKNRQKWVKKDIIIPKDFIV